MAKRFSNSEINTNTKKRKLDDDDDIDALWGDELDESVFDDCIKLASQALDEDKNREKNESFIPAYDAFKAPKAMFSSTQNDSSVRPTTSNKSSSDLEMQKLRSQCEEKDGEVAILRSQLREVKMQSNVDHQKSQSELKAKLTLSEKQFQSIKSELEFKNLEVANLKQKVLSLSKLGLINMTITSDVTNSPKPSTSTKEILVEPQNIPIKKLYTSVNVEYPLKNVLIDSFLIIPQTEKYVIDNKLSHSFKKAIPYLQNKTKSTRVILSKNRADLQHIYPLMLKLCDCTSEELGSNENIGNITKIVWNGFQSLDDLLNLLEEIKNNLRTEDLLEADTIFLKRLELSSGPYCDFKNDLGRKCAFILNFLSVLLPYNVYLKDYFIHDKQLDDVNEDLKTNVPCMSAARRANNKGRYFLNQLITIIHLAGEIRKTNVMSLFLNSTIKLFTSICKINCYPHLNETVCKYTKEILFSRPLLNVIFELTYLLREASRNTTFVQFLLNKSANSCMTKKGVLYFDQDACRFYVFVLLFQRGLSKNKTVPVDVSMNIMRFIYNTYNSSYFLHHQDIKECECLPQLYKLEIELIFRMLDKYTEELKMGKTSCNWNDFFNNRIILKVLNLMAFHCYELTEKYITVYSQFKEIERRLRENGVCDLDRLNVNEDIPEIDSKSFEDIGF